MTVALIVGHTSESPGAFNQMLKIGEYQFNKDLAYLIQDQLAIKGYHSFIVYRDCSYSELPDKVNLINPSIAVSLHCNAFNESANGTETLYYKGSSKGRHLAECIQKNVLECLGFKDRGLKPCEYDHTGKAGDRGGWLLAKTNMPCVIAEPFFIDNDAALALAIEKRLDLAMAMSKGIIRYLQTSED